MDHVENGVISRHFAFSDKERQQLRDAFAGRRRFPRDDVENFVWLTENTVGHWARYWPVATTAEIRATKTRLANIEKHLDWLLFEFRATPDPAIPQLALRLSREYLKIPGEPDVAINDTISQVRNFLETLRSAAVAERCAYKSGHENRRKTDLAECVAKAFCHAFRRNPTQTKNSAYMDSLAVVSEAVGLSVGKDLAGDGMSQAIDDYAHECRLLAHTENR